MCRVPVVQAAGGGVWHRKTTTREGFAAPLCGGTVRGTNYFNGVVDKSYDDPNFCRNCRRIVKSRLQGEWDERQTATVAA